MKSFFKKYNSGTLGGILLSLAAAVLIFLIIGISYFYAYLPSSTNHGESITVPNVEGMNISELEEFLVSRDLRYEVNDSSYSDDYPPLTVLKQYPAAGAKVKENRKIFISVNRVTPPTVPMPNLVDGSLLNAEAVLRGNELRRGRVQFISGPFLNLVKEMKWQGRKIEPGTRIPKGSIIDLVVEDGGNNEITTPDIVGYTLEDSKIPIFGSNLHIGEVHVVGDTIDNGPIVILRQVPEPGTKLRAGDAIEVWVGKKGTEIIEEDN
jgi:eukaryotic-like serine/threonine-protein kinase